MEWKRENVIIWPIRTLKLSIYDYILIFYVQQIYDAFDRGEYAEVTIFDFSNAVDSASCNILLKKTPISKCQTEPLKLLSFYLIEWIQLTQLRSLHLADVTYGVQQGSVLGPLLFIIYIHDLPSNVNAVNIYKTAALCCYIVLLLDKNYTWRFDGYYNCIFFKIFILDEPIICGCSKIKK